jgi:hypothetical protein
LPNFNQFALESNPIAEFLLVLFSSVLAQCGVCPKACKQN